MNTRHLLPTDYETAASTPRGGEMVVDLAAIEFDAIDECIRACEQFAAIMVDSGVHHALLGHLRECVFACVAYLDSIGDESHDSCDHAVMCASICQTTADECLLLDCQSSRRVQAACQISRRAILSRFRVALGN